MAGEREQCGQVTGEQTGPSDQMDVNCEVNEIW